MEEVKSVNSEDYDETTVANNNTNTRFSVAVRLSPLGVTVSNSVGSVSNSVGNCCVVLDGSVPNQVEVFSGDGRSAAWIVSHRLDHSCTANRANRANSDSKSSIQTKSSSAATAEEKNGIAMDRGADAISYEFCSQENVWNYTSQQLQAFLRSQEKKAVVLLMGCSGAGKSHTLLGNTFYAQRGILPRFLESVWGSRGADGATVRDIDKAFESESVSLLQLKAFVVQNEKIIDLLDPPKMYEHVGNVFYSSALGPIVHSLRTFTATSAEQSLLLLKLVVQTLSVIVSHNAQAINNNNLVISVTLFSDSNKTVRVVDFVELAGLFYNNIGDTGQKMTADVFAGQSLGCWSNRLFTNFLSTVNELAKANGPIKNSKFNRSSKNIGTVPNSARSEMSSSTARKSTFSVANSHSIPQENINVAVSQALLLYLLQDIFLGSAIVISFACLRGDDHFAQDNWACLDFLTKLESYYNSLDLVDPMNSISKSFISASNTNSLLADFNRGRAISLQRLLIQCKQEIVFVEEEIESEMNRMNQIISKKRIQLMAMAKTMLTTINAADIDEDASKYAKSIVKNKVLELYKLKVDYMYSYEESLEDLFPNIAIDVRRTISGHVPVVAPSTDRVEGKKRRSVSFVTGDSSNVPGKSDGNEAEDFLYKISNSDNNRKILQALTDFITRSGLVPPPLIDLRPPTPKKEVDDLYDQDFDLEELEQREKSAIRKRKNKMFEGDYSDNATNSIDKEEEARLKLFAEEQSEHSKYLDAALPPIIPWNKKADSHDPFVVITSSNHLAEVYNMVSLRKGYTIMRGSSLPLIQLAKPPTKSKAHLRKEKEEMVMAQLRSKSIDRTDASKGGASSPVSRDSLPAIVPEFSISISRPGTATSIAQKKTAEKAEESTFFMKLQAKEEQSYNELISLLQSRSIIPPFSELLGHEQEAVLPPIDMKAKKNNKKRNIEDGLYSFLLPELIPEASNDLIYGLLIHRDNEVKLIPGKWYLANNLPIVPGTVGEGKTSTKRERSGNSTVRDDWMKLNGKPIPISPEVDESTFAAFVSGGITLKDQDIITIGNCKHLRVCIPQQSQSFFAMKNKKRDKESSESVISSVVCSNNELTDWEHAVVQTNQHQLQELMHNFLREKNKTAHLSVNREVNAILQLRQRSRLMRMSAFDPSADEVAQVIDLLSPLEKFRISQLISMSSILSKLATTMRIPVQVSCVVHSTEYGLLDDHTNPIGTSNGTTNGTNSYLNKNFQPSPELENELYDTYATPLPLEHVQILCTEGLDSSSRLGLDTNNNDRNAVTKQSNNYYYDYTIVEDSSIVGSSKGTTSWWWTSSVMNERFLNALDVYRDFIDESKCNKSIAKVSELYPLEKNPFHSTAQDEVIGVSFLYLDPIRYLLDINDNLRITNYNGDTVGYMRLSVRSWIGKVEPIPKYITADKEISLASYHNKKLIINFYFDFISELPYFHCSDVHVFFKFYKHLSTYKTPRASGTTTSPVFRHSVQVVERITDELLDYVSSGCVEFEVFGRRRQAISYDILKGSGIGVLRAADDMLVGELRYRRSIEQARKEEQALLDAEEGMIQGDADNPEKSDEEEGKKALTIADYKIQNDHLQEEINELSAELNRTTRQMQKAQKISEQSVEERKKLENSLLQKMQEKDEIITKLTAEKETLLVKLERAEADTSQQNASLTRKGSSMSLASRSLSLLSRTMSFGRNDVVSPLTSRYTSFRSSVTENNKNSRSVTTQQSSQVCVIQ